MEYILEKKSENYHLMGGKATALAKMGLLINNISDWFVVSYEGFDKENKCILEKAKQEI